MKERDGSFSNRDEFRQFEEHSMIDGCFPWLTNVSHIDFDDFQLASVEETEFCVDRLSAVVQRVRFSVEQFRGVVWHVISVSVLLDYISKENTR